MTVAISKPSAGWMGPRSFPSRLRRTRRTQLCSASPPRTFSTLSRATRRFWLAFPRLRVWRRMAEGFPSRWTAKLSGRSGSAGHPQCRMTSIAREQPWRSYPTRCRLSKEGANMMIHSRPEMIHSHQTAPTQFVEANGIRFAYRRFGEPDRYRLEKGMGREMRSKAPNRRRPSMRALQISAYGDPLKVLELADIPEPGVPGAGEVLIDVELAPLNLHDLLFIRGYFGGPPAPTVVGNEGFGRVAAVGPGVTNVKVGDHVLAPIFGLTWRERLIAPAQGLFPLPDGDPQQFAQLGSNPPTAALIL